MSWRNTHHYSSDVTISANVDEALDKISFVKIKEAYEDRLEEKENNPEYFRNSEKFRDDDTIDFDIDVGDYDLMYINDESLDDFDLEQIINTVEDSGYTVVNNKYCWNERENRYYEINFETFHPYDYKDEKETLEKAKEWLNNELKEFQANLVEKIEG